MANILFTESQRHHLEANPNVAKVSDRSITYAAGFKVKAVQENLAGKSPYQIFVEHDFDMSMIGTNKPNQCLKRWRKTYEIYGSEGFYEERRGKGATGRPSTKDLSAEEKLAKAESEIAYLKAELDLVKKLEARERQVKAAKKKR